MAEQTKTKKQRIKLRMYGHPVKYDGNIIATAKDGSWVVVEFDGPLDNVKLYPYGTQGTMLCDQDGCQGALQAGAQLWEVL